MKITLQNLYLEKDHAKLFQQKNIWFCAFYGICMKSFYSLLFQNQFFSPFFTFTILKMFFQLNTLKIKVLIKKKKKNHENIEANNGNFRI